MLEYYFDYEITTNQKDCFDKLSPWGIFDFLQDIAGKHVEKLGYGYQKLIDKNMTWILARSKYEVLENIGNMNKIKVKTWPHYPGRLDFDRDFLITDENDSIIIKATTKWCIIDYSTRRFLPANNLLFEGTYLENFAFQESFKSLPNFNLANNQNAQYEFEVKYSQIDHNHHLNNTKYSEEIWNALKLKKEDKIKEFEINFVKEVLLGDKVSVYYTKEDDIYLVEGYSNSHLSFKAKVTLWKKS